METNEEGKSLEQLLDRIYKTSKNKEEEVELGEILDTIGHRSFGPLLLLAGLITVAQL